MFYPPVILLLASLNRKVVAADCHAEGDQEYCLKGRTTTQTADCHTVGGEVVCFGTSGPTATIAKLQVQPTRVYATNTSPAASKYTDGDGSPSSATSSQKDGEKVGVVSEKPNEIQHPEVLELELAKTKGGHGHGESQKSCIVDDKESYTLKLRVAAVFILLTTSTIGILAPIFLRNFKKVASDGLVFTIFKQFGTGVIISTVFIHLLMHAVLQFLNPCVGEMEYEGTVMAIAMGGAFFSFLVDYAGVQYLRRYRKHQDSRPQNESHDRQRMDEEKLSVFIMEGGIIFHSILVGVLLAVTPDTELPTIFAVVLIHQLFEGIALGARIAPLENVANRKKILMAIAFSVTAPLGMAIGIGVRKSFNSNDKSTIVTLGTMDALSAGVLAWVAFVELWSKDWLHGEMRDAPAKKQIVGMISLVLGIAIMSFLGKWA